MQKIDRKKLARLIDQELVQFQTKTPTSQRLTEQAKSSMPSGVPMPWMSEWHTPYPLFSKSAKGSMLIDVDDNEYIDLCLGDTGAMFGHSPDATAEAVGEHVRQGITTMLPTEAAISVSRELQRRFGLPYWQIAMTATDANRFVIRMSRIITRRPKVLVFNGCYHGTLSESLVKLRDGEVLPRSKININPAFEPSAISQVVEFNDVEALETALAEGDVACVLAEPALTNVGIVLPEEGYHDALRELTRKYQTLLIIDETHTLSAGFGGYTRVHGLQPDFFTVGKAIASGIPVAAYGMTEDVVTRLVEASGGESSAWLGLGGTLSGNQFAVQAMRVTLEKVATEEAFAHMVEQSGRLAEGIRSVIEQFEMPWHAVQLGARVEYMFSPEPYRTGGQAEAGTDRQLDAYTHLYFLNRGILITPFHNMLLVSPQTSAEQVDRFNETFKSLVQDLI
jgi:glutamate-1-semialdehyde 2,1-aminomutase